MTWRTYFALAALMFALGAGRALGQTSADDVMSTAIAALASGKIRMFEADSRNQIRRGQKSPRRALLSAGKLEDTEVLDFLSLPTSLLVQGRTIHKRSVIYWTISYSSRTLLLRILEFNVARRTALDRNVAKLRARSKWDTPTYRYSHYKNRYRNYRSGYYYRAYRPYRYYGWRRRTLVDFQIQRRREGMTIRQLPDSEAKACTTHRALCAPKDVQTVEFLFATNRRLDTSQRISFTGDRASVLTFGAARVRVPKGHQLGHVELPSDVGLWGFTIFEQKQNESKHFVIKSVVKLDYEDWTHLATEMKTNEAIVFVHGYANSFEDSLYRHAQIIWDLQYTHGISVLFSWASNGRALDYIYDQQSALLARDSFIEILTKLKDDVGVEKIHIIAHSMGNFIVLDALANQSRTERPLNVAEIIMAAPDVDRDHFVSIVPRVRNIALGMTLYASSADKALAASRDLARGVPRAGDVPADGPVILSGVETIDVTAMGAEFLGLNHDVFASSRAVLNDVKAILNSGLRPPSERVIDIHAVPEGSPNPRYWRYVR